MGPPIAPASPQELIVGGVSLAGGVAGYCGLDRRLVHLSNAARDQRSARWDW